MGLRAPVAASKNQGNKEIVVHEVRGALFGVPPREVLWFM